MLIYCFVFDWINQPINRMYLHRVRDFVRVFLVTATKQIFFSLQPSPKLQIDMSMTNNLSLEQYQLSNQEWRKAVKE
jgi:hypothetical protein